MTRVGFDVLPMHDHHGRDDELLFWRWPNGRPHLDVAIVFSEGPAVASRLPPGPDWSAPFGLVGSTLAHPTTFASLAVEFERRAIAADGSASRPRT